MSKELEAIRQAVESRRQNLDTIAKNKQLEIEAERRRIEDERKRRKIEITSKSNQNQILFQNSGVVKLLEEIRDSGLLRYRLEDKNEPEFYFIDEAMYRDTLFSGKKFVGYQKVKKQCELPVIKWTGEHLTEDYSLHNHNSLSLIFNYSSWPRDDYGRGGGSSYDSISFSIKDNVISIDNKPLKEISDLPQYIAEKISKTIN